MTQQQESVKKYVEAELLLPANFFLAEVLCSAGGLLLLLCISTMHPALKTDHRPHGHHTMEIRVNFYHLQNGCLLQICVTVKLHMYYSLVQKV